MGKKLISSSPNKSSTSVANLMQTPPNKLGGQTSTFSPNSSVAKTHSASYHPPHGGLAEARVNAGGDKVVSRPNHFPQFRKRPGSQPVPKETIFSGPTSAPVKIERMNSVACKLHSDPFDGQRQTTIPARLGKKKLMTPRHQMAAKFGTRRVDPHITVAPGFVAGSNLVFAGGKKQFESPKGVDPSKIVSPIIHNSPASAANRQHRRIVKQVPSPVQPDKELLHFDPTPTKSLTREQERSIQRVRNSNARASQDSVMMGGVCKPVPRRPNTAPFTRASTSALVHPPWHTSTPRASDVPLKVRGAIVGATRPPWHTSTPRTAAREALPRCGVKRLPVPGSMNGEQAPRTGVKMVTTSPYTRSATTVPGVTPQKSPTPSAASPATAGDLFGAAESTPSRSPLVVPPLRGLVEVA